MSDPAEGRSLVRAMVWVRQHALVLEDPNRSLSDGSRTSGSFLDDRIGVQSGELTLLLERASGRVPVWVDVVPSEPAQSDGFSHVVDAPFAHSGGPLALGTWTPPIRTPTAPLDAGRYRARVAMGNLEATVYDGDWGVDFYHIWLWRSSDSDDHAVRRHTFVRRHTPSPGLREDEALRLLATPGPTRFGAYPSLAAIGTPEALTRLIGDADDELARNLVVAALALTRPIPFDLLRRFLHDSALTVRQQTLATIDYCRGLAETGAIEFDFRLGSELMDVAMQDGDPSVVAQATSLRASLRRAR